MPVVRLEEQLLGGLLQEHTKACERAGRWSKMPDASTNDLTTRTYFSSDGGFLY